MTNLVICYAFPLKLTRLVIMWFRKVKPLGHLLNLEKSMACWDLKRCKQRQYILRTLSSLEGIKQSNYRNKFKLDSKTNKDTSFQ